MDASESQGKVFVVDTNLFFVKRLSDALRQQGFDAIHCSEPAYALTMIEWNMPVAILCATTLNNSMGFEIPSILRADPKTSHIPVVAIGDRGQQSQLQALRAGYEDVVDRRLGAEEIVAHLISLLSSHRDGFQPTQMLTRAETALDGRLSLVDLPGVIQVLSQSRQTGGLHINADSTDGIIFFNGGEIIHAESGQFAGDDAIIHLVKSCYLTKDGVYKFIPGHSAHLRTVQGNLNALILDALRQLDEEERDTPDEVQSETDAPTAPLPQEAEPETRHDAPPAAGEPLLKAPAVTEAAPAASAENDAETPTEIEIGATPAIEVLPEVQAETVAEEEIRSQSAAEPPPESVPEPEAAFETQNVCPFKTEECEEQPEKGNNGPAPFHPSACESIIDEPTLRELNELLSSLKVEEQESHE